MKVLCAQDGLGCGWIRLVQPLREMARHGHEVTFTLSREKETIEALRDTSAYDIIVGQRFAGFDGMSMWRKARRPGNRLVYENDDDLFTIDMANWAAYQEFSRPLVQEAIKGYAELSDLVTVTCDNLAEVHRAEGARKVAVLKNYVPEYVLELPRAGRRRPRLGWVGGGSHGIDMHECVGAVRRFLNKNPDWDLYLGGNDYRPTFNPRNWDQMTYGDWRQINEHEREYYESIDFDIGLAPVKDTPFAKSKSAIKALEYAARGIPVVASDVLPYQEFVQHGHTGFLVRTEHEWMKYIRLLATDSDLREQMSENARSEASRWTVEDNWQRWERAYEELF